MNKRRSTTPISSRTLSMPSPASSARSSAAWTPPARPSSTSENPVATRQDRQSTPLPPAVRNLAWLLARIAAATDGRGGNDL